jgi:glycosyltransferase involved in cell wall biosynthesis
LIRVLHVAGGVEPELGGPAVAILNYVRSSVASDVEVHLLVVVDDAADDKSKQLSESLALHGVATSTVEHTGRFRGRARHWGISMELARWMMSRVSEFDVIVLHGAWLFSSFASLVVARLARKPCVMIPHESLTLFDIHKPGSKARVRAKSALENIYARSCSLFVFASALERSDSLPRGTNARTTVIPCPLFDADHASVRSRSANEWSPHLRVGFLGRFHTKKNLDVLIEALAILPPEITLVAGGDGPDDLRAHLRALAANLGVSDRITWCGFIAATDKDAFFESIDVLVMPSEYESFGVVAGEAMLRGVPAIVSPRTGIAEIISAHGGGLLVQPRASSIADMLTGLSANRAMLSELSAQGQDAARHLTFSHAGALLRKEYLRL